MSPDNQQASSIGASLAQNLYADARLVTNEIQPYYLLHKDTVRTFLHEKINILSRRGELLGLLGIEMSLLASILTATFNDWHWIKGTLIEACFIIASLICGLFLVIRFFQWWRSIKIQSVDSLAEDLGNRGSIIQPQKQQG